MTRLVLPRSSIERLLAEMRRSGIAEAWSPLGSRHDALGEARFARTFRLTTPDTGSLRGGQPILRVFLVEGPPSDGRVDSLFRRSPDGPVSVLFIGDGAERGHLWTAARDLDGPESIGSLDLVGACMWRLRIPSRIANTNPVEAARPEEAPSSSSPFSALDLERWSRTIGALGGFSTWYRLVTRSVAVVGCGRTGSLVAVDLARLGLRRLTLVDADLVELHNLGEMDAITPSDLGRPKVDALHARLAEIAGPGIEVTSIPSSTTTETALPSLLDADVVFSCVDNDAARLALAILATLYHKVLIDVGTGVLHPARDQSHQGADVRIILPGDGCLLCRGGLTDLSGAIATLARTRRRSETPVPWWRQRAGSLRTINQLAAGLAVHLFQELLVGRITASLWTHLEFEGQGRLRTSHPSLGGSISACLLCRRAGFGDQGFGWSRPHE